VVSLLRDAQSAVQESLNALGLATEKALYLGLQHELMNFPMTL
jgi:hypothetical protein